MFRISIFLNGLFSSFHNSDKDPEVFPLEEGAFCGSHGGNSSIDFAGNRVNVHRYKYYTTLTLIVLRLSVDREDPD
jgi:hypothetical protein